MIAEDSEAGALPMPTGVDCVTLPALRKETDGWCKPCYLEVRNQDVLDLRAKVIRSVMRTFEPDVLIVDHLPRGAGGELIRTLESLRRHGRRCVLGLREVLQDPKTVDTTWYQQGHVEAMKEFYDAVWVYGDPAVYDPLHEYTIFDQVAEKVHYTGYLDQRPRLEFAGAQTAQVLANLPQGRLAVCVGGGGQDGAALSEVFVRAELAPETAVAVVTGPYMPAETRQRLRRLIRRRPRLKLLEFVPDSSPFVERADRVIAMGGYNTMCEVLSFEKHALIVPRVNPKSDQWIRAERMRARGLIDVLHPDQLSANALSDWLARDLGSPPASRRCINFAGLNRIPSLLAGLLEGSAQRVPAPAADPQAVAAAVV